MREYLTVSELNKHVEQLMQNDVILVDLWLKGEISGFKHHRQSGHFYFTLKDQSSLLSCVMFRSQARQLNFTPQDGMEVLARGRVAVYAPQGRYQLYIRELRPFGIGAWQLYLEKVRQKCQALGYFDIERKRPIPAQVNRVGIVTSQDGAALRDITKVLRQRHRHCQVILVHSAVQGNEAAKELARGIELLNEYAQLDVIIIGRGGGSWEDLLPFSTETVVEAVAGSAIPVISAVGHEVDYSLADLAADVRAATPTQAAVLAVPDMNLLEIGLQKQAERLKVAINRHLTRYMEDLDHLTMKKVWKQPELMVEMRRERLRVQLGQLYKSMHVLKEQQANRLALALAALDGVSPLKTMQRGYALLRKGTEIISSGEQLAIGDSLEVSLQDADLWVEVIEKEAVLRWRV